MGFLFTARDWFALFFFSGVSIHAAFSFKNSLKLYSIVIYAEIFLLQVRKFKCGGNDT